MERRLMTSWLVVAALASGCSSGSSSSEKGPSSLISLESQAPEDSTGTEGDVSLSLQSSAPALTFADSGAASKTIGDVTLTYAKFNIAKIKIKPKKENSEDESTLEDQENSRETEAVEAMDNEVESSEEKEDPNLTRGEKPERPELKDLSGNKEALRNTIVKIKEREDKSLAEEAEADPATKWSGPFVFNALTGDLEGGPLTTKLVDGSYRRIQFQLKRYLNDSADPASEPLLGNVFAIQGDVKVGEKTYKLKIDWHVALNFRIAGDSPFSVSPGEDNSLSISLNMDKWFEDIDWTQATVDESSSTIIVNRNSNQAIMRLIHRNLKKAARAGKDANKNGKLEESEAVASGEDTQDASSEAASE